MSMDTFNEQATRPVGGRWAKLDDVGAVLKGVIISAEITERRDRNGVVVNGSKSGKPRKVWRLTVQTDERLDEDDDGIRQFDANESAQEALRPLLPFKEGGQIALKVTKKYTQTEQGTYVAQYKAPDPADLLTEEAAAVEDLL